MLLILLLHCYKIMPEKLGCYIVISNFLQVYKHFDLGVVTAVTETKHFFFFFFFKCNPSCFPLFYCMFWCLSFQVIPKMTPESVLSTGSSGIWRDFWLGQNESEANSQAALQWLDNARQDITCNRLRVGVRGDEERVPLIATILKLTVHSPIFEIPFT